MMDNEKRRETSGTWGEPSRMDIASSNDFESWNTSEGHTTELMKLTRPVHWQANKADSEYVKGSGWLAFLMVFLCPCFHHVS